MRLVRAMRCLVQALRQPCTGNGTRSPCAGIALPCAGNFVICTTSHVLYIQARLSRAQTDTKFAPLAIIVWITPCPGAANASHRQARDLYRRHVVGVCGLNCPVMDECAPCLPSRCAHTITSRGHLIYNPLDVRERFRTRFECRPEEQFVNSLLARQKHPIATFVLAAVDRRILVVDDLRLR